jgi:hypothetical protein
MAVEAKTIDEETTGLCDAFDADIAPKSIWRNNNNKLYLILKSIGAGFSKLRDVIIALKYRFDPRYCSDDDLESTMLITGTKKISGKASMLRVIAYNNDLALPYTLPAGTYRYTSTNGDEFTCMLSQEASVAPQSFVVMVFVSVSQGSFPVSGEANASIATDEGYEIPQAFSFEALDNSGMLGRQEETMFECRQRLLTDTTRHDSLKELEAELNALPTIYGCNLMFNPTDEDKTLEDGSVLAPYELLIMITGSATDELASIVLSHEIYKTHMTNAEQVVWYKNPLFVGGKYPVYYATHAKRRFWLTVYYAYDTGLKTDSQVEAAFNALLAKYKVMTEHVDAITEPMLYEALQNHGIVGVTLLKVYIQDLVDGELVTVPYVQVPRLMVPELQEVAFVTEE